MQCIVVGRGAIAVEGLCLQLGLPNPSNHSRTYSAGEISMVPSDKVDTTLKLSPLHPQETADLKNKPVENR